MSHVGAPFQLLEINLISARDLPPLSKSMQAYAVAWVDPDHKMSTRIDEVGHTDPTWNQKFVFRVDDEFLRSADSVIIIEIYTSVWRREVLIGTVGVLVSSLLPPSPRSGNRKPKVPFVALQIRRPSGRPQGFLNIGVNILDGTVRSMPLYSELSYSEVGDRDHTEGVNKKKKPNQTPLRENHEDNNSPVDPTFPTFQCRRSEKNDSAIDDYNYTGAGKQDSMCDGYSFLDGDSELVAQGFGGQKRGGILNANGSLCSDEGPSPSVAAVAKGMYPMPPRPAKSTVTGEWSEISEGEGIKMQIERWRTELHPVYDKMSEEKHTPKRVNRKRARSSIGNGNGNGLFSCFGTAFGCEFSISCGGSSQKKRYTNGKARLITASSSSSSEITYEESFL